MGLNMYACVHVSLSQRQQTDRPASLTLAALNALFLRSSEIKLRRQRLGEMT
jgi:hypothetical protein